MADKKPVKPPAPKNPVGRPKITFPKGTAGKVEEYAFYGSTDKDIGVLLDIGESTLKRDFGPHLTKGRSRRRMELLKAQTTGAMEGNGTMLVWLGKQALGQQDERVVRRKNVKEMSDEELQAIVDGKTETVTAPKLTVANGGKA